MTADPNTPQTIPPGSLGAKLPSPERRRCFRDGRGDTAQASRSTPLCRRRALAASDYGADVRVCLRRRRRASRDSSLETGMDGQPSSDGLSRDCEHSFPTALFAASAAGWEFSTSGSDSPKHFTTTRKSAPEALIPGWRLYGHVPAGSRFTEFMERRRHYERK